MNETSPRERVWQHQVKVNHSSTTGCLVPVVSLSGVRSPMALRLDISAWNDVEFAYLQVFFFTITVVITGIGSEAFFGSYVLQSLDEKSARRLWKLAQFIFPLFVGCGYYGGPIASPLLVLGLWKCGYPETLTFLSTSVDSATPVHQRVAAFLNGIGLLVHHSIAVYVAIFIQMIYGPLDSLAGGLVIPLIAMHWFAMVKYYSLPLCAGFASIILCN